MLYDVEQAAIKLNVSKQSIYNKIKLKEFKDKVVKKAGKTYIDEDLLNLIKESLKFNKDLNNEVETEKAESTTNEETAVDTEELLNLNKELIKTLIEQLQSKDIQIQELNNRLQQEQELHKNTQVLLQQEQAKPNCDIILLEEHFKEVDNKLMEVKEQMEQRKEKNNKGFLDRFFSKE